MSGGDRLSAPPTAGAATHTPIVRSLTDIYTPPPPSQRYANILATFASVFQAQPDCMVRTPGRVNLIGEHIDYNGFGVLPVAIERDTIIAARIIKPIPGVGGVAPDENIHIAHCQPEIYGENIFSTRAGATATPPAPQPTSTPPIAPTPKRTGDTSEGSNESSALIPSIFDIAPTPPAAVAGQPDKSWTRYIQAGVKGVFEADVDRARSTAASASGPDGVGSAASPPTLHLPGLQLLVDGTIPPAAGLSSSSSIVCGAAIMTAYAMQHQQQHPPHQQPQQQHQSPLPLRRSPPPSGPACLSTWSKLQLADISASSERFIGTAGGGMDQAICLLAQRGHAMKIDFEPTLSCAPVSLPRSALLLVAHSATRSEKALTATTHFNKRVLECTLAAHVLAKHLKVSIYEPKYWYKKHAGRRAANVTPQPPTNTANSNSEPLTSAAFTASQQSSWPTAATEIPKLTLYDVLQASGKSLVEMITWIQQAAPKPVDYTNEKNGSTASTAGASGSAASAPLHAHLYTLPELLSLFGLPSLKSLCAFRPSLAASLREDEYFAHQKRQVAVRKEARLGRASSATAAKTRVAFGRTVTLVPDDEEEDDEDGDATPQQTFLTMTNATSTNPKDKPFPWEGATSVESDFASSFRPKYDLSSAAAARADNGSDVGPIPYRSQGDPSFYSPEQTSIRQSLRFHPLVTKELNRFWTLLPKTTEGVAGATVAGEIPKEEYVNFFLRLCKLFNPDLEFDDALQMVKEDWDRDVARIKEVATAAMAAAMGNTSGGPIKSGKSTPIASPTAKKRVLKETTPASSPSLSSSSSSSSSPPAVVVNSLPYASFAASLFELVDIWSPDSTAQSYANLLDQIFAKLTVRVESRGGTGPLGNKLRNSITNTQHTFTTETNDDEEVPTFALYQRALHVYTEALRVQEFTSLCGRAASAPASTSAPLQAATLDSLGALMNASHVSCSRNYECSTEDLDTLVNICVEKAGAVGTDDARVIHARHPITLYSVPHVPDVVFLSYVPLFVFVQVLV